jgi:hypothetical protein
MLNKAIEKLRTEIDSNKSNPYIQVVGEFLLQDLQANPNNAEKILQEGKTIGKSLNEMKKVAEKKKVGNCAVLTDQEGFATVLKYFEIEGSFNAAVIAPQAQIKKQEQKPNIGFNVELDF